MSYRRGRKRTEVEPLPAHAAGESTSSGLVGGGSSLPDSSPVDPQRDTVTHVPEQPEVYAGSAHIHETGIVRDDSHIRVAGPSGTSDQRRVSPDESGRGSPFGQRTGAPAGVMRRQSSPELGDDMEDVVTDITVPAEEVVRLSKEYDIFMTLMDNAEVVIAEAVEATERVKVVLAQMKTFDRRMSPTMRKLFGVSRRQPSGKAVELGNNREVDKAAAKTATEQIVAIVATMEPVS